ncbi:hypothetical protein GQX73_g7804 [Xylaria multiplex]|uniref:Proteophosphoglycan 5 n=1 Tax=Xylaria multiplex TaxID=323545 RepID=A0A7C8IKI0_9PEZI|nr:hypothetical protein GQX73_g7804 [Xylaria multiplex]
MQFVPTPKSTPNRRHPPTGRNRNSYQKVYASENDLPSYKPNNVVSPSTPQKSASGRPSAPQTQSTNQKQRNKGNKSRSTKNGIITSPSRRLDGENTTLHPRESSAPIFAGSTFHASPAPSALPLPSFLGLSSADSPSVKAKAELAQESSPPQTDSDDGSPVDEPISSNGESPLEFFFRADRAEKARVRRASSANTDTVPTAAFTPLQDSFRKECNTIPKAVAHNSLRRPAFIERNTSPGIPASELHGGSRLHVGPAFSTPYQERIRAACSNPNPVQPTPTVNKTLDPSSSEALKRYLFTGQLGRSESQEPSPYSSTSQTIHRISQQQRRSSASQQQSAHPASQRPPFPTPTLPRGVFPASVLAGHAPCAQPVSSVHIHSESSPRSDHLRALEVDLRRALKLDSLG